MQYRSSGRLLGELKEMAVSYDDEVLPQTPADLATPFIFQPGQATSTLFTSPIFPSQTGAIDPSKAGELRGLYGAPGALSWKPEWSAYQSVRPGNKIHWGVDIYAPPNTPLVAVVAGELEFRNQPSGLGLYAALTFSVNDKTYVYHYGHLASAVGGPRTVAKGEVIGKVGCSGNADYSGTCSSNMPGKPFSASHVHFALLPPAGGGAPKRSNPLTPLGWKLLTPPLPPGGGFS